MKYIAMALLVIATGCASSSQAPLVQGPTIAEAQAAVTHLKLGMTDDEALAALAFPKCPPTMWDTILWGFDKTMRLHLGPTQPPTHTLSLHFGPPDGRVTGDLFLDSWQIGTNKWEAVDTEHSPGHVRK